MCVCICARVEGEGERGGVKTQVFPVRFFFFGVSNQALGDGVHVVVIVGDSSGLQKGTFMGIVC